MSSVEVLISAMHQKDFRIFEKTNISSDALMINQCEEEKYFEVEKEFGKFRILSTTERGLSNSRNMALKNAVGTYCLLCDDDEFLYEGYKEKIIEAYQQYPRADIICFQIKRKNKEYSNNYRKINYLTSLRVSSWQITFKLKDLQKANIKFDPNFGSGTPIGSGEENIFLYDCLRAGLNIYYVPICIGEVAQNKSQWFVGFTEKYFINRGVIIRRLMGRWYGMLYCIYFSISKYQKYHVDISFFRVIRLLIKGMNMNQF